VDHDDGASYWLACTVASLWPLDAATLDQIAGILG